MKKFLLLLAVASSVYSMTSCSKSNTKTTIYDTTYVIQKDTVVSIDTVVIADPKNPITGTWTGVYFIDGAPSSDSSAYTFYIRPDGQMVTAASGANLTVTYSTGPWTLTGTAFFATLNTVYGETPNTQTITATYDSTAGSLNGTFLDVAGSNHASGTIKLKRIP